MFSNIAEDIRLGRGFYAPELVAERTAQYKAQADALKEKQAADLAAARAAQIAENERLSLLTVPDYDEYWGLSEATKNWVNPFPARPGTVPGRYERFDYTVPGSGIAGGGNFALAFDRAFSSQWKSPVAGLSDMQQQLLGGNSFLSGEQMAKLGNTPQEAVDVAKFNQALRDQQSRHRTYTTNKEYLQAFQTLGIDPSTITTPEALAAISPDTKAAVFDLVQRQLQAKNQRAKPFGFGDALGIGLSIGAAFAPGPWSAAALGASGAAAGGGDLGDIALAGGIAGFANFAGGKIGEAWDKYRAGQGATTNVAALGGTPANLYNPSSVFGTGAATTGTGSALGGTAANVFGTGAVTTGTGAALGGTAANVFGALPATGSSVLRAVSPAVTSITQGGRVVPFYDPSAGAIRGTTAGATALSSGRGGISALSSEGLGRNIVHAGLSSAVDSIREPSSGMFGELADQLPRVPTITYPDYAPVRSGVPVQAGFERTSNIGVPSEYGYVPTGLTPETALPYGSGLDPYAPVEAPDFDVSPYFQGPKLFHRGGGVVNVDSGARPTDQESFYQTYESGSQQYSDNLGEGMGITYDRVEGTDIPPQSRLQVFETPPMGVGSLNGTARDMFAAGGPVQHFMAGGVAKGLSQMPLFADDVLKALPSTPKVNPVIPVSTSSLYTPLPPYQPELPMGQESIEDPEAEWLDVYHGTISDTPIEEFDPGKERRGEGISVALNPEESQVFTPGGQWSRAAGDLHGDPQKIMPLKLRTKNIFDSRNPRHIDRLIQSLEVAGEENPFFLEERGGIKHQEPVAVMLEGLKLYSEELKADYGKAVSKHRVSGPFTELPNAPLWIMLEHELIARHIKKLGFEGTITVNHWQSAIDEIKSTPILKVFPPDPRRTEKEKEQTEILYGLPEDYAEAAKYSSEDALYLKQLEAEQVPLSEALYARDPQWRYPLRSADAAFEYDRRQEPGLKLAYGGGVGSLNETARDMSRYAYGGGVGSLNETARTMTYAGGGIVRAAAMVWQPFKVKIKNQAIFGEFMGYTKTGKVRVLDQESGVEKLYPKSRVRRAYSDEPLPDEPVKKAVGGPIIKTAAELLKRDPAGFFNKSQFVVQEAKLPQATGQRWQQLFQDKGINKAELGGLGLLTFLGLSRDEPITKEAVAEFIDENRLEVGEDYRSTKGSETGEVVLFEPQLRMPVPGPDGGPFSGFHVKIGAPDLEESTRRPTNFSVVDIGEYGDNRGHSEWRIIENRTPGGPKEVTDVSGSLDEVKVKLTELLRERGELADTEAPRWGDQILRSPEVDREIQVFDSQAAAELLNYREIALTDQQTGGLHKNTRELIKKFAEQQPRMAGYKPVSEAQTQPSQHNFPENTLVHLRVTDRPVEINGVDHENVLYAEEFQSDWAQGAINRGILRPEDISRKAELIKKLEEIRVKYRTPFESTKNLIQKDMLAMREFRESQEISDELEALDLRRAYSPFLESGDKKGSVDQSPVLSLAISRLLKEAVDNGQDYVVFSNYGDQVTRWGETKLEPIYQETIPNLAKKIVRDLGGYVKPKFKTKEKENKYYKQNPDKVGKEEDAFFGRTVIEPKKQQWAGAYGLAGETAYPHLSANRFVVHITDAMAKKIREEGQPVLSRAAGGPIIKGAAKVLTKPKKDPLLPAETLMATRPVEPLATTRTGYRVVNVDDAGNLVSQADARVVLPPELGSQHNVPMWLTLDDQYAVENYSHGSFEPGERRQVLLTYDFNEKDILQGNLTDVETEFSVGRAKLREMRDLYGEPISPAETLTATSPLSPTGSLFDEKKGRKLLIVGCCETKSKVEELIPASERYKGPLFTTLNKAGVPKDVDVAVLSAKHGLIRFDTPLEDYNVKMKDGRKDLLKSPEQLARINNTVDGYGEVFVAGGEDYRNFLDEAGIKGKYTTYTDHADKVRGIGDQRSILAKWLYKAEFGEDMYHLTDKDFSEFIPGGPENIDDQGAIFFRPDPSTSASQHNVNFKTEGAREMPVKIRGDSPLYIDEYNQEEMRDRFGLGPEFPWIVTKEEAAKLQELGFTHVETEHGGKVEEIAVFDPKNIRSKFAQFDPAKKDSADILAAKGGGVSSLNGIARNMTRYAYGGGVGSMNETARSM